MFSYNFLPPEEKQTLSRIRALRVFGVWFGALFLVLIFSILLMLPAYFLVSFQKDEALRTLELTQKSPAEKRIQDIQQSITFLKQTGLDIKKISESPNNISNFLSNSIENLPRGMILTSFRYRGAEQEILFQGIADTRSAVTAFEEVLKKNQNIERLDIPLSNLVSEKDIRFDIRAYLKKP